MALTKTPICNFGEEAKNFNLNSTDNKQIYSYYNQAKKHSNLEPLLVIKTLRQKPLAIIDLEHLFELQEDTDQ